MHETYVGDFFNLYVKVQHIIFYFASYNDSNIIEMRHVGHSNWIYSVTFSADCKYLVTGSRNNTCKLWDVKNGFKLINTIKGHNNPISSVTFSPQDKYLAISWNDNIWKGHTETSFSSSFSVNSKYLATGSRDKTCKIWDIEKGFELIATIQGHIEDILSIAFSFLRQQISSNCFW
ncbi:hypothetical protein ABPG73_022863 [Tetrahymena malaccensis]